MTHLESRARLSGEAAADTAVLFGLRNRQVDQFALSSSLRGKAAKRGRSSLAQTPKSKITLTAIATSYALPDPEEAEDRGRLAP